MDRIIDFFRGTVRLKAVGPVPANLLNLCAAQGIDFWAVASEDAFTLYFSVCRKDASQAEALAKRAACTVERVVESGAPRRIRRLKKRWALSLGLLLCLGMLLWSSLYVWEIEVTGNKTVKTSAILNALEDSGVGIGSFWPAFTSDNIRSRVLVQLPELSWITVNVNGSRAEVIVRERIPKPELVDEDAPADIVAGCAGIILTVHTLNGVAQILPGQTVAEGDVLISGEALTIQNEVRTLRALGSITARTWHEITAVCPLEIMEKRFTGEKMHRYSLAFGGQFLKFYPNSGILRMDCDKIDTDVSAELDGIFTLPLLLRVEKLRKFALISGEIDRDAARAHMETTLMEVLQRRIGESGEILSSGFDVSEKNGLLCVTLRAECVQEIGKTVERIL